VDSDRPGPHHRAQPTPAVPALSAHPAREVVGRLARRSLLTATGVGITALALPAASSAASGPDIGETGEPAVAASLPEDIGVTPVTITSDGVQYDLYRFDYTGTDATRTYTFTPSTAGEVEVVIVAGGGSGGRDRGGGGGAGGVIATVDLDTPGGPFARGRTVTLATSTYTVTVGRGGPRQTLLGVGNDGTDSGLTGDGVDLIATGGGGGANNGGTGRSGGSGGGGSNAGLSSPGAGAAGQGFRGGNTATSQNYGAGGGGAGSVGGDASGTTSSNPRGGDGGTGLDIRPFLGDLEVSGSTDAPFPVAGGGGGYGWVQSASGVGGAGGSGVGGRGGVNDGLNPTAGVEGTGSGGGGGGTASGEAGGAGVVYLRVRRS
jgi:mucin-19